MYDKGYRFFNTAPSSGIRYCNRPADDRLENQHLSISWGYRYFEIYQGMECFRRRNTGLVPTAGSRM
jgi:hypothetical protein